MPLHLLPDGNCSDHEEDGNSNDNEEDGNSSDNEDGNSSDNEDGNSSNNEEDGNSSDYEEDTKDSDNSEGNEKNNSHHFNDSIQLNQKCDNDAEQHNEDSEQPNETQNFPTVSTFEELGIKNNLCRACKRIGWASPTQIQIRVIPSALKGHDIIGLAETGSGKTGAFALPILQNLMHNPQRFYALILIPTRELAFQIKEQFEALGSASQIVSCVIVGGMEMKQQADALKTKPHIVVGTPGRLLEHLKKTKGFHLQKLKYLVMDEADRILQMDFQDEVNAIMQALPKNKKVFLFSATMTSKVNKLQRVMLTEPVKVEISSKFQTVKTLKQFMLFVPYLYKIVYLAFLLYEIGKDKSIMIFCMTSSFTLSTALTLRILGFNAFPIFGLMDQNKRLGVLNKFRSKEKSILIATDVASRGLDIPNVDYVINFDCPTHSKDYIHRVGRTARVGKQGTAITLVDQYTALSFVKIEKDLETKIPLYPTIEEEVMVFKDTVLEAAAAAEREKQTMDKKGDILSRKKRYKASIKGEIKKMKK